MLLGARFGMLDSGRKTARDYVQDGLIVMWDGIENAGWGVHDAAATNWLDLVGGVLLPLNGRTPGSDFVPQRQGDIQARVLINNLITIYQSGEYTQEIAFRVNKSVPSVTSGFVQVGGSAFIGKYSNASPLVNFIARVGSWQSYYTAASVPFGKTVTMQLRDDGASRWLDGQSSLSSGAKATHATGSQYVELNEINADFSVDIFSIRLYHANLTSAEIAANYAVDKARFGI